MKLSGPDQDLRSVDPDLGPNCLQRLSADDNMSKVAASNEIVKKTAIQLKNMHRGDTIHMCIFANKL